MASGGGLTARAFSSRAFNAQKTGTRAPKNRTYEAASSYHISGTPAERSPAILPIFSAWNFVSDATEAWLNRNTLCSGLSLNLLPAIVSPGNLLFIIIITVDMIIMKPAE